MTAQRFAEQLNIQIGNEFAAHQQYVASAMTDLLAVVNRAKGDAEKIEDYVSRETGGGGGDPTAPRIAGA
jgi:bacterioferritin B